MRDRLASTLKCLLPADMREYAGDMNHLSMRHLRNLSAKSIAALPGPTPVKSGDRTLALLIPLKSADPERLAALLAQAESLASGRNRPADDAALAAFGDVDPVDWSVEAVRALMDERKRS